MITKAIVATLLIAAAASADAYPSNRHARGFDHHARDPAVGRLVDQRAPWKGTDPALSLTIHETNQTNFSPHKANIWTAVKGVSK